MCALIFLIISSMLKVYKTASDMNFVRNHHITGRKLHDWKHISNHRLDGVGRGDWQSIEESAIFLFFFVEQENGMMRCAQKGVASYVSRHHTSAYLRPPPPRPQLGSVLPATAPLATSVCMCMAAARESSSWTGLAPGTSAVPWVPDTLWPALAAFRRTVSNCGSNSWEGISRVLSRSAKHST